MENNMTFESWYKSITESVKENAEMAQTAPAPANPTASVQSSSPKAEISAEKNDIIKDVDSIMSQLAKLSVQVKEELGIEENEMIEEDLVVEADVVSDLLNADPLFALVGAGVLGVLTILGFGATAGLDAKRNIKIGKSVSADFEKLKKAKMEVLQVEVMIHHLQQKKRDVEAGASGNPDAIEKSKKVLDAQIENATAKKDQMSEMAKNIEETLDAKYADNKLEGAFSGRVRKAIAAKKDEIFQQVNMYKLKAFGDEMDPEVKKDLVERLKKSKMESDQRMAQAKEEIQKHQEEIEKVKKENPEMADKIDAVLSPEKQREIIDIQNKEIEKLQAKKYTETDQVKALELGLQIAKLELKREQIKDPMSDTSTINQKIVDIEAKIKEAGGKVKNPTPEQPVSTTTRSEVPDKKEEEPKKEEPKKDPASELEADIKSYNKNIADETASMEKAKAELKSETDPAKIAKLKDSVQQSKEDITELKTKVKELKAEFSRKSSAKESLMFSANELGLNELVAEISTKENWQLENNSALYAKYKMEIDRQSSSNKINESNAISIADKFRTLLG
jgi:hypothetical protein